MPTSNPDWKDKYYALVDRQEAENEEHAEAERLLSRAITRLTVATAGLDPSLDPHLKGLREVVRKGVRGASLRRRIDTLCERVVPAFAA